jgi:hypothetical protein
MPKTDRPSQILSLRVHLPLIEKDRMNMQLPGFSKELP